MKRPARNRVHERAVAGAIVCEQLLDLDAVAGEELDRSTEERDDRGGLLVGEDLGLGQARAIVNRDVHVLPADL
jgi:hypothetical protein